MADAEAMAIELESAKQKAQFRSELMKKFAEEAQKITPLQIELDSADLNGSWGIIRSHSQRLALLSSTRSSIEKGMERFESTFAGYSFEFSDLTVKSESNRRHISIAERNKASSVKRLKKQIETKEKQLKSIEEETYRLMSFMPLPLLSQSLCEKKDVVAAELRCLRRRMADEDTLYGDERIVELEENQRIVRDQLMAARKKKVSLEELMKVTREALDSCRAAIAVVEHVYFLRLRNLKPDGYVELMDITDVIILQGICWRSNYFGGVVVKFCVVNDQLLELLQAAICKEKFKPKLNRLYELSVDDRGIYHVFELSAEEAAKCDFKPFDAGTVKGCDHEEKKPKVVKCEFDAGSVKGFDHEERKPKVVKCEFDAGTVKGFDHEEKKPKISHDYDEMKIFNSRKDESELFGEEQITRIKQEADHSCPSKVPIETEEKSTKRRAHPLEKQQQPLASSSKRLVLSLQSSKHRGIDLNRCPKSQQFPCYAS